ncbi:MAG: MFS transporter [Alphaproteobacteria bacterium]|nr:MFS transporter [Alphaproteobacteria bacterium]
MRAAFMGFWALFLGFGLVMLGNALQGTLLGVRASMEGFSTNTTGFVMAAYFVGFLGGSYIVPKLLGLVGHVRVFAAMASIASMTVLVHAVYPEPITWMAMRLVTGFAYAGLYIVIESWINDRSDNANRGTVLSIYMLVNNFAMAAGPLLLNLSVPEGYDLFILASVLVSVALVPLLLSAQPVPDFSTPDSMSLKGLYRSSPLGFMGSFLNGLCVGALFGMGPVFGTLIGLSIQDISIFMGAIFVGGFLLQFPIGWFSDRFDRRLIITLTAGSGGAVGLFAFVVIGDGSTPEMLFALSALAGGIFLPIYSLCIAHVNDFLPPKKMVAASAALIAVNGAGAAFGPLIGGFIMDLQGPEGLWLAFGVIQSGIAVFALWRMTQRAAVPLDEQGPYVAYTAQNSTSVIAEMGTEEYIEVSSDSGPEEEAAGKDGEKEKIGSE